jgi:hypothetical protein
MKSKHRKDILPGGLADKKKSSDFDQKQLNAGISVELEHTKDRAVAQEIAMDHLTEDLDYYKKLKTVENMSKAAGKPIKTCSCGKKLTTANATFIGEQDVSGIPAFHGKRMMLYNCPKCDSTVTHLQDADDAKKSDRVEVTADGKRELDVGGEPLDKLKNKWKKLKKALDSSTAIMDLSSAEGDDDKEGEADAQQEQPAPEDQQATSEDSAENQGEDSQDAQDQASEDDSQQAEPQEQADPQAQEQEVIDFLREEGYDDSEIAYIIHNHSLPIPTKDDHAAQNEAAKGEAKLAHMQSDHDMQQAHAKEAHDQERRQDEDEHKHTLEHKRRMSDVEYEKAKSELVDPGLAGEHKKKMLEIERDIAEKKREQAALEVEHKKRMLDLEYQKAHKEASKEDPADSMQKEQMQFEMQMKRMEKELELEFKKKELALKLKLTEEAAKQKHEHAQQQAEADAAINAEVKANQAKHKIAESKKAPKKEKDKD